MATACKTVLSQIFDEQLSQQILDCAQRLQGTPDFHAPIVWRELVPRLAALDSPEEDSHLKARSACHLMSAFKYFGGLSLDLRDVPGLGHGRILTLVKSHHFDEQIRRIATGKSFAAVCITEASGGSDLHALRAKAERYGDGYLLNGRKQFVSRLRQADVYIVFVHVADLEHGLSVFLVPADSDGLVIEDISGFGLTGCSWGGLEMKDVFVPKCHRVGGEGQGFSLFATHFSFWRCAMAAAAIGAAEVALDNARNRLKTRDAFGGPIGRFTHLQQEYAVHAARVHMAWLLVQSAAVRIDQKRYCYVDAAMAKAESLEATIAAVQWVMLMHGAQGVDENTGLGKVLCDLLSLRIADGTTDVLRGQVARGLLGEDLYSQSLGRDPSPQSLIRERQLW